MLTLEPSGRPRARQNPFLGRLLRVSWGVSPLPSRPPGLSGEGQCFILASSICPGAGPTELPCFLTSVPWLRLGFIQNVPPVPTPHAHPTLRPPSPGAPPSVNTFRAPCPSTHPEGSCQAVWLLGCLCPTPCQLPMDGKLLGLRWREAAPHPCPHLCGAQAREVCSCTWCCGGGLSCWVTASSWSMDRTRAGIPQRSSGFPTIRAPVFAAPSACTSLSLVFLTWPSF